MTKEERFRLLKLFYDYYRDEEVLRINNLDGTHSVRLVGSNQKLTASTRQGAMDLLFESVRPELEHREAARRLGGRDRRLWHASSRAIPASVARDVG